MKKIFLLLILVTSLNTFAQLPYSQDFGTGTSTPAGWTLSGDWLIDPSEFSGGLFGDGPNGGSKLFATNSTGGFSTATYTFSTIGNTAVTIGWNEYRDDDTYPPLTVITSTNNFVTSSTLTITQPLAGSWGAVTPTALGGSFDNQTSVQIRFQYLPDNSGLGIGIDDISITGNLSPVFYSKSTGNLDVLTTWGVAADGTGSSPVSFTTDGQRFNIVNRTTATIASTWTVGGVSSSIVVGDGVTWNTNFTIPSAFSLSLTPSASLTVQNGSTLTLVNSTNYLSASSVSLATNSTVDFAQTSSVTIWSGGTFQNLTISSANKSCSGSHTISGILNLNGFDLQMAGNTVLTLNGTKTGSGKLIAAAANIVIGGSGAFGILDFTTTSPAIRNLTISRSSSGSVILGNNLTLNTGQTGAFTVSNGILDLNGKSLTINRAIAFGAGSIKGSPTSTLSVAGLSSAAITGSLLMDQTSSSTRSLYDLILNRSAQTLTLGNSLDIINSITPTLGTIALGSGNVTLKSTSSSKARVGVVGGGFTGTIKVETYIPGGSAGWNTLGPAGVSGLTVTNWDGGTGSATGFAMTCTGCINSPTSAGGSNFVSIQSDPAGNGVYTELISSSALTPGTGYWVYIGNSLTTAIDITQTTTGAVVTGPVTSGTGFISNPYPSPISHSSLQASNGGLTSVDVYNPNSGAYTNYNGGIPSDVIPMGQGFYANGVASISFQESHKIASNNSLLKTSSTNSTSIGSVFQLKIDGWYGDYDNTYVRFHNNATPVFDDLLDAYKRYATPGYLGYPGPYQKYTTIATVNTNQDYGINSLPYAVTSDAVIPVVAKASATGQYTISPVDIQNLPPAACVILKDKLLNINHDLRTGSYVFNMSDTTSTPRFELTICADQTVTSIKQLAANNNNVLIGQDGTSGVFVKTKYDKNTKSVISAYNVMGQKIITDKEIEGSENLVYLDFKDLHNQIVIIKVMNDKGQTTKKVYLN